MTTTPARSPSAGGVKACVAAAELLNCTGSAPAGDEYTAGEQGAVSEQVVQLLVCQAVEHLHVRLAPRTRTGNDLRQAVAVEVAHQAHAHPAVEVRSGGQELELLGPGRPVEHLYQRLTTRVHAGDNFGPLIAVEVPRGHVNPAPEGAPVGEEVPQHV